MIISLGLQGCVPYYETRWTDVENPEFLQDWAICEAQVMESLEAFKAEKTDDFKRMEDCMLDKGWSKERDWDIWILETV
jgi:hypothetical protein